MFNKHFPRLAFFLGQRLQKAERMPKPHHTAVQREKYNNNIYTIESAKSRYIPGKGGGGCLVGLGHRIAD